MFTKIVRSATHTITSNIQNAASTRASSRTRLPAALLACAALTLGPANLATAAVVSGGSEAYNYLVNLTETVTPPGGSPITNETDTQHKYIFNDSISEPSYDDSAAQTVVTPPADPSAAATLFFNRINTDIDGGAGDKFAKATSVTDQVTLAAALAQTTGAVQDISSSSEVSGDYLTLGFTADAQIDSLSLTVLGLSLAYNSSVLGPLLPNTDMIEILFGSTVSEAWATLGVRVIGNEQIFKVDGTSYCGQSSFGAYAADTYMPSAGCDPSTVVPSPAVSSLYAEANALHIYFRDFPLNLGTLNGDIILGHTLAYMTAQVPEINGSQLGIALSLLLSLILLYRERDGGFVA